MMRDCQSICTTSRGRQRSSRGERWIVVLLLVAGCAATDIDTTYGVRSGSYVDSVNGTAVFGSMFRAAGHKVTSVHRISPRLENYDVIVWVPDQFVAPNREQRAFLERWLAQKKRTLIYVGRDYDAEPEYWQQAANSVPPMQSLEMWRRRAISLAAFEQDRARYNQPEFGRWFTRDGSYVYRPVTNIVADDEPQWLEGIDTSRLQIVMGAPLRPVRQSDTVAPPKPGPAAGAAVALPDDDPFSKLSTAELQQQQTPVSKSKVLIRTEQGPLLSRVHEVQWQQSSLLVVSNGSFLLNLPLVNVEHRKLAGKLISECGSATKNVAFLETDFYDGVFYGSDDDVATTGLEVFTVWPIGIIVMHAFLVGIVACFALFPIFGRAREQNEDMRGDFGKHIDALGKLLQRTKDEMYARDQLQQYYRQVRGDVEERK